MDWAKIRLAFSVVTLAGAVALPFSASRTAASTFEEAREAFRAADFEQSLAILDNLVETQEDALTVGLYAEHFWKGLGTEKDIPRAIEYFEKAGDLGWAVGYAIIGDLYNKGVEIEHDAELAQTFFIKGAELGNNFASLNAAEGYLTSRGTQAGPANAIPLLEELIQETGDARAYEMMAGLLALGIGTEQDLRRAVRIYSDLVDYYTKQGNRSMASEMATRAKSARDALKDGLINRNRHLPVRYFKPTRGQTIEEARRNAEILHNQWTAKAARDIAFQRRGGVPACSHVAPEGGVDVSVNGDKINIRELGREGVPRTTINKRGGLYELNVMLPMTERERERMRARVSDPVGHIHVRGEDGALIGNPIAIENDRFLRDGMSLVPLNEIRLKTYCPRSLDEDDLRACRIRATQTFREIDRNFRGFALKGATVEYRPREDIVAVSRPIDLPENRVFIKVRRDVRDGYIEEKAVIEKCE